MIIPEKLEECPKCAERGDDWIYDGQICRKCGYGSAIRRRSETPAMVRRILFRQGVVPCCLCGKRLKPEDKVIREHMHALALGGPDEEDNMGYAHEECAARKTNGTPATTYGSDKHAIAKVKRLRGETKQDRPKRKIQSRGFDKSMTRTFKGEVRAR
jgi:5-methylcytosine-specific restriction endonuclease McrA